MGWFDVTLIMLKKGQNRDVFLADFNKNLSRIGMCLEIDAGEFIIFNDSRSGIEKETVDLTETMSMETIIEILSSAPGLGLLSYRHPNFNHIVSINYLSWDDNLIHGFSIGFNGKEVCLGQKKEDSLSLIHEISELVDYKYVIGSIYDDSNIRTEYELSSVLKYIEETTFSNIDKRH